MVQETVYQVILLPQENFWDWVAAVRDYVAHFGANVTYRPENAVQFQNPRQIISIVNLPVPYPMYGDIVAWFQTNAADVQTDVISVSTPDNLRAILAERISKEWRFGVEPAPVEEIPTTPEPTTDGILLQWPTDYDFITQHFGRNPDIYGRYGLPGHEGLDIRAPLNTNIYACNHGTIIRAEHDAGSGAYGRHIRIRHSGGYKTIYAHLNEVLVSEGETVRPGQVIGLSNSTGNSTGHHLHLTLKLEGATANGLTSYPWDIIDPTPYLLPFGQTVEGAVETTEPPVAPEWEYDNCLVGLHGRADGPMFEPDWQAVTNGRVEALKLLTWARGEDVDRARQINPNMFIMARTMFGFKQNKISPEQFAETVGNDMQKHYDRGIRYFEIHNEPNLTIEGWGTSWQDGSEFGAFFLSVIELLKTRYPECKWGWPGLSPGPAISGQRFEMWSFVDGARVAMEQADWIGVHCYWQGTNDNAVLTSTTGLLYQAFRDRWPNKLIFITEFSNSSRDVDKAIKARQYVKYYEHLRNQSGVGAAFSFVASATSFFEHEAWRSETGQQSAIPSTIGSRNF